MVRLRRYSNLLFDPESADDSGLVAVGGDLQPQRLLEVRRGKGVIDRQQRAGTVGQLGDGGDIDNL